MPRQTVLVSAAGSTNGINVIKALRAQNEYDLRIIGTDSDACAAGLYLADSHEVVPKVSEETFGDRVSHICKNYDVSILIPTHSVELGFYSSQKRAFEKAGVKLMISPPDKMDICNDKSKLAIFFQELGIRCPQEYDPSRIDHITKACFPLFIKSRFGTGSTYARKIDNSDELNFYLKRTPDPIIQEYIKGQEYTVNIVSDFKGKVIGALPIKRLRARHGLAVLAETELNVGMIEESKRVIEALGLIGPSNIQIIIRNDERVFIEVNPRFASGSLPLAVASGLNIPLILVKLMNGEPIPELRLEDGRKMSRYWDYLILEQAKVKP